MITMHARPRQTDRQTDELHGNSVTIHSNECITRKKCTKYFHNAKLFKNFV